MLKFLENILGETCDVDGETRQDIKKTLRSFSDMTSQATVGEVGENHDKSSPEYRRALAAMSALQLMQGVAGTDGIDGVLGFTTGAIMAMVQVLMRSKTARRNATDKSMVSVGNAPYSREDCTEAVNAVASIAMKAAHQLVMPFEEMAGKDDGGDMEEMPPDKRSVVMEAIHSGNYEIAPEARASMEAMGVTEKDILEMIKGKLLSS